MLTRISLTILLAVGLTAAYPYPKEGKSQLNHLDYQIDPQLLNYHLQQLGVDQQKAKQAQPATVSPVAEVQPQQYSVPQYTSDSTDQQLAELQKQFQKQYQEQLRQLQLQFEAQQYQAAGKIAESTVPQSTQSSSLALTTYPDPSAQYQQPSAQSVLQYQQPSAESAPQYQQPTAQPVLQYQQPAPQQYQFPSAHHYAPAPAVQYQEAPTQQYTQPALQQYQAQNRQQYQTVQQYQAEPSQAQIAKQSLLGVAYSSAVDASKTQFSGYGIKYSF